MRKKVFLFKLLMGLGLILFLLFLGGLIFFLVYHGIQGRLFSYLNSDTFWRLLPPLAGSVSVSLLASSLAVPLGLVIGIYLDQYAKTREKRFFLTFFRFWAGIPSLVAGIFGFLMILSSRQFFGIHARPSLLVSAFSLWVLILPYTVHSSYEALRSLPFPLKITGLTLGAGKTQNLFKVILPAALPRMGAGWMLASGRALEDTAAIMLTGAAAFAGFPSGLLDSFEALPFFIYSQVAEHHDSPHLAQIIVAGILMTGFSVLMAKFSFFMEKKHQRKGYDS